MKQLFIILALIVLTACADKTTGKSGDATETKDVSVKSNTASNANADKMLRSFYTEYIMQGDVPPTDKARMAVIRKYCTAELAQKIEDASLDSDPFLSAQDSDVATVKTLVIQQDDKNKDMYAVCYTWPSTNQIICTDVIVKAVGKDFKISHVEETEFSQH